MVTRLGSKQAVLVMFEINRGQPGAVLREGEVTKLITRLDSKQVVPNVSRYTTSYSRQAGHQKKILVVKMFPGMKKFMVAALGRKQDVPIISKYAISFYRLAGHQKMFLVIEMFFGVKKLVVVMTVLGVKTRM